MNHGGLRFYRRLSFQTGLAVALVTALVFGVTGLVLVREERNTLTRELTLRILAETRSLALAAGGPLLRHDPELGLHPLILKALKDNPDLQDLVVLDRDGLVQGHRDLLKVGSQLPLQPASSSPLIPSGSGQDAWLEDGEIVIRIPVLHLDQPIGTLIARASRQGIEDSVRASMRRVATIAGVGMALGILLVLALVTRGLRPLGPMREAVQRIGDGDLDSRVEVEQTNELGLLADLINRMASGLSQAQTDLIQKERLDQELAIAHELQATLLPQHVEAPDGYDLAAHYTPALEVSGDYYDVIPMLDGSIAIVTADVSGKGVPGLVVMAMLRVILRGLSLPGRSAAEILSAANRMMEGSMRKDMFITCLYGVFDPTGARFSYASAGHCPPAIYGASEPPAWLGAGGKPMGMFPEAIFDRSLKSYDVVLHPGQGLLLYTDGLIESMDAQGEQLGTRPVLRVLQRAAERDGRGILSALLDRVDQHRQDRPATDDLTLLTLKRIPVSAPVMETPTIGGLLS